MKKIAYFDVFAGISGDMTLGAFVDAGLKKSVLIKQLAGLKLKGYKVKAEKTKRNHISCTKVDVIVNGKHRTPHNKKSLKSILSLIGSSRLKPDVKDLSAKMFRNLAEGESRIHGVSKSRLHFHEIGDTDSIVDIVGCAIAVKELGIDRCFSSDVTVSRGVADTAHGKFPAPAPITIHLLKGIPLRMVDMGFENITPTGACILKTLCGDFGSRAVSRVNIEAVGYGAGSKKDTEMPNALRIYLGSCLSDYDSDEVSVIETEIDDMNALGYSHIIDTLLKAGALDAYLTPVYMKKSRPGILLTALCRQGDKHKVESVIFDNTTTTGIRHYTAARRKLNRRPGYAKTRYGRIGVKKIYRDGILSDVFPEYDDCYKKARDANVPFLKVYEEAKISGSKTVRSKKGA
jgi:hypothetical protein